MSDNSDILNLCRLNLTEEKVVNSNALDRDEVIKAIDFKKRELASKITSEEVIMNNDIAEKVAKLIGNGGSIVMHANDFDKLKKYCQDGSFNPTMYNGIKIWVNTTGATQEGAPIAVKTNKCLINFDLRQEFKS